MELRLLSDDAFPAVGLEGTELFELTISIFVPASVSESRARSVNKDMKGRPEWNRRSRASRSERCFVRWDVLIVRPDK